MKIRNVFLLLFFLPFFLSGCIGINEEFTEIRNEILNGLDDEYRSEYQFSIGSTGITVSTWFVDATADEELPADILRDVSSVQVGIYKKIKGTNSPNIKTLRELEDEMQRNGWKSIVINCEEDELSGIYVRRNPAETLDRLFVISLNDEELILVEVEGDLKEVITTIIREKGMNIKV